MRLLDSWMDNSNEQEKMSLRKKIFSCFLSIDSSNNAYASLQKAVESLMNQNVQKYEGSPYLQVIPLIFINHHRFYNNEICEFLKKNVQKCGLDKQELENCFCLFGILFFLYAGCNINSSLDMLDDVVKHGVEQKIFEDIRISKRFRNTSLCSILKIHNETEYVLASALWSLEKQYTKEDILIKFERNQDDILLLYDVFSGLMNQNEAIDYISVENDNNFLKTFFNFCVERCVG